MSSRSPGWMSLSYRSRGTQFMHLVVCSLNRMKFGWVDVLLFVLFRNRFTESGCAIIFDFRRFSKIATLSFVVYLPVHTSFRPHGTTRLPLDAFWWNLIFELFSENLKKLQVSLKHDKNNGHFNEDVFTFMTISRCIIIKIKNNNNGTLHEDVFAFMTISRWIVFRVRNVLDKISTDTSCSVTFFPKIMPFEIMSQNMVEAEWPQMTVQYGAYNLHTG